MSRTRAAPTPTNISTKSEPLRLKNGTPASPAIAFASSVFAVTRAPHTHPPSGPPPAKLLVLVGHLQEIDNLADLFHCLVDPRHVVERDSQVFLGIEPPFAPAERHRRARAKQPPQHEINEQNGQQD